MSELHIQFGDNYTEQNKLDVIRIQNWLADPANAKCSQAGLAKAIDKSPASVSTVIKGKYAADPTEILSALIDHIQRQAARAADDYEMPFCETSVYRGVDAACRRAHNDRDFGLFVGKVGIGKTEALRRYCAKTPSAVLVDGLPGMTVGVLLDKLSEKVGAIVRRTASQAERMDSLVSALMGGDRVLIIDEAEQLSNKSLEYLRRISDSANVGVVLVGTPNLLSLVKDPNGRFGQISSRIGLWPNAVTGITVDDSALLVKAFFGPDTSDEVCSMCWTLTQGSARALHKLVRNTARYARNQGREIDETLIQQVGENTLSGVTKGRVW